MGALRRRLAPGNRLVASAIAWAAFWVVATWTVVLVLTTDVRRQQLRADQASFVLQALSLVHTHDLSYTATDFNWWRSFGWSPEPLGLFFQAHGHSWAFAKPYGYSVWLAPFMWVFGDVRGIAVANASLLIVFGVVCYCLIRLRFRGVVVPVLLGSFLFASVAAFNAFNAVADLFEALLIACCLLGALVGLGIGSQRAARTRLFAGAAAMLFGAAAVAEKAPMVLVVGPLLLLLIARQARWRQRLSLVILGGAVFLLAISPYLWYSSGSSWTPYGGDRYYAEWGVPFSPTPSAGWKKFSAEEVFSPHYVTSNIAHAPLEKVKSLAWYVVGRHTGLVMTMPLALAIFGLVAWYWRKANAAVVAIAVGALAYVAFYVILFPGNYYGGGTSLGNRYFLQISPVVLALAATAAVPAARVLTASLVSMVVGVAMLWPHYAQPRRVLSQLGVVSALQSGLPDETGITPNPDFHCPGQGCLPEAAHPLAGRG
jgi:4-amino-4-deoxy-L-arabinose transferase-like glycosyltransferase